MHGRSPSDENSQVSSFKIFNLFGNKVQKHNMDIGKQLSYRFTTYRSELVISKLEQFQLRMQLMIQ